MHFYRIYFSYLILFKHDESLKLKLTRALIFNNSFTSAHPSCSKETSYISLSVNDLVSVLLFLFLAENKENMFFDCNSLYRIPKQRIWGSKV